MRHVNLLIVLMLLSVWLAGCGGSAPATPAPAQEAEAPAVTEEPAASESAAEATTEAAVTEEAAPTEEAAAAASSEGSAEPITIVFSNIAETATLDPAIQ